MHVNLLHVNILAYMNILNKEYNIIIHINLLQLIRECFLIYSLSVIKHATKSQAKPCLECEHLTSTGPT